MRASQAPPLSSLLALFLLALCICNASGTKKEPLSAKKEPFFRSFLSSAGIGSGAPTRGAPHGTPAGFSEQSEYVGLERSGAAIAVGDFNRDRFVDLLMLDTGSYTDVSVHFWDHESFRFVPRGSGISISGTALSKIVSAHVADFNNDGILDVLLSDGEQGVMNFGDGDGNFNASSPLSIPEIPAVAVVDANADLTPELFVAFANGTRGFWRFDTMKDGNVTTKFQIWQPKGAVCAVTASASIATVDLNGDCLPEFAVPTACGLEVWKAPTAKRAIWDMRAPRDVRVLGMEVFNAAHGDGAVVYADFDGDGTIDVAVANLNRQDLVVHLNMQRVRASNRLCDADPKWRLVRKLGVEEGQFRVAAQRVGKLLRGYDVPPAVHVGDFDFDGRPDILIVDADSGTPALFRNTDHWRRDMNHHKPILKFHRLAPADEQRLWKGSGDADVVTAAFFDVDESGRQDIVVVRRNNDTRLVWNNYQSESDALFFKGTILSALKYKSTPRPFAPVPGNTFKVSYVSRLSSRRVVRVCSQCSQGGHWTLRACNCVLGLAHIANYIEEMSAGAGGWTRTWTNLMPNSMAVVWAEAGEKASRWRMEYFTQRRGGQMLRVVAVLVAALAALGAAILWLQTKEKRQDREDHNRERARLFHFGGL